jgi:predicted metal-binding membrane protein
MLGALRTPDDDRWHRLSLLALVGAAWLALAAWGASPYAGLLDHAALGDGSSWLVRLPAFVVGWTLMTVAMMLPSSLPLVNLFRRVAGSRRDGRSLLLRLLVGYLGVWGAFGVAAYAGDAALHALVASAAPPEAAVRLVAPLVALVAGLYQFTHLKELCLDRCRSPYSFLAAYWRGRRPAREALRLGVRHGLFCLGCCWTLMLLMFAVGGTNLAWMLALGALMAAERGTRLGRRLTQPVGFALVVWAVLQVGHLSWIAG